MRRTRDLVRPRHRLDDVVELGHEPVDQRVTQGADPPVLVDATDVGRRERGCHRDDSRDVVRAAATFTFLSPATDQGIDAWPAEGRVDFRSLVRDLAGRLRARIELRQIGARDDASMYGGCGPCGRALCCSTFLRKFEPVSVKMAKVQGLSLNPSKISGMCGRLMCCLRYEFDPTAVKPKKKKPGGCTKARSKS